MANFIMGIISLSVGVVVLAGVFITTVKAANTTYECTIWNGSQYIGGTCNWSSGEISLWGLLTIVGIAGLVYGVLNVFGIV